MATTPFCRLRFRNRVLATSFLTTLTPAATFAAETAPREERDRAEEMVITAPVPRLRAGSDRAINADALQRKGANDFGTIMRYEPLIGATGAGGGSGNGKSSFDRGGYTGYNIRGLESNRVGIDVDGIPQPEATGRSYAGRAGLNTFGIGRDYIDPYLYGNVAIQPGATSAEQANTAIGGNVSFRPKSADDYLYEAKQHYAGFQSDYDSSDRSWHNGVTAAAGDEHVRGIVVYSRRDGQQTRNNSDRVGAYPANWHSDALLLSGILQASEAHKRTYTAEYYNKTTHTHFDAWNRNGSTIIGNAQQSSYTRRWGISLKDDWTPSDAWVDSASTKIYIQRTQAHDATRMPDSTTRMPGNVYSSYDTDTVGIQHALAKSIGRHDWRAGFNASASKTQRPFHQKPLPNTRSAIMQPEADSKREILGAFVQDQINFAAGGHHFALIPGIRVVHQSMKPENLGSLTTTSKVLNTTDVTALYHKNSDTEWLPSLTFQYALTPRLMSYLQYRRGAQFANASQRYGSWNLGSSYAGRAQYALIGNAALKTETSDNLEWGLKGEVAQGVTLRSALFYNSYKNFIAYTRYRRADSPAHFANVPSNIYTSYQAENRDKAFIYGGEISATLDIGRWLDEVDGLHATLAYGYAEGKAKSRYLGDAYRDLDSVAPMKAIVGLGWDDPAKRYGTALTATFVKGKRATATSRETYQNSGEPIASTSSSYMRVPGYGIVDLSAWWQVAKHVKVNGGVYNLTNRKYWDYLSSRTQETSTLQDSYDNALAVMPGRSWQLGINIDF